VLDGRFGVILSDEKQYLPERNINKPLPTKRSKIQIYTATFLRLGSTFIIVIDKFEVIEETIERILKIANPFFSNDGSKGYTLWLVNSQSKVGRG
jgi:hypothetical protein